MPRGRGSAPDFTPEEREQIVEMYVDQQLGTRAIAAKLGRSFGGVRNVLVAAKVPMRKRGMPASLRYVLVDPFDALTLTRLVDRRLREIEAELPAAAGGRLWERLTEERASLEGFRARLALKQW